MMTFETYVSFAMVSTFAVVGYIIGAVFAVKVGNWLQRRQEQKETSREKLPATDE